MSYAGVIKQLTPAPDGVNTDFTAPTQFVAGTSRVIVNGVAYDPSDDQWGFTELSTTEIRMKTAPKSWYTVQLFYHEPVVVGSPHHPTGAYP